jgi:shikimate dehydrogenase
MVNRHAALAPFLDNELPAMVDEAKLFAGSAGESPSKYSRSPGMWNAAFKAVGLDAAYVPFDVSVENLTAFVQTVRALPGFIGGNVTVPHKLAIMELVDEIDPIAAQIGAVNTYSRMADGRLVGANSDADGLLASMLRPMPGMSEPFLKTLAGARVLLLGSGGAARAAAFIIAGQVAGGSLAITNRTMGTAGALAAQVSAAYPGVNAVTYADALALLPEIDVVVNTSTVGQSGLRHLADGRITTLEPFSSLAPADPVEMQPTPEDHATAESQRPGDSQAWFMGQLIEGSRTPIERNNTEAAQALLTCKPTAAFVDAVYSPDETMLLRQARQAGFRTLNGKGMLIMQAADSFVNRMTRPHLIEMGLDPDTLFDRVVETMAEAFDAQG